MAYLDDHPPARSQFREPRRAELSGVIVVHTAENVMDTVGPDTGAEAVARFIASRDTPGSYHDLHDSDSSLDVVRYECEAFHDGTGSNPHSLGLSFACSYLDWPRMSSAKRTAFLARGAAGAARMAARVKAETGIIVPARRITRAQSERLEPGFIDHARRDPTRRKDPGDPQFPWDEFLALYAHAVAPTPAPTPEDDDMPKPFLFRFGAKSPHVCYLDATRQVRAVPKANVAGYQLQQRLDGVSDDVCVLADRRADGSFAHPDPNIVEWSEAIVTYPFVGPLPTGWSWWPGPRVPAPVG